MEYLYVTYTGVTAGQADDFLAYCDSIGNHTYNDILVMTVGVSGGDVRIDVCGPDCSAKFNDHLDALEITTTLRPDGDVIQSADEGTSLVKPGAQSVQVIDIGG